MLEENEQLIIWAQKQNVYDVNVAWDVWRIWATYNMSAETKCLCECCIRCLKKMSYL
jgi:hypothetical protein